MQNRNLHTEYQLLSRLVSYAWRYPSRVMLAIFGSIATSLLSVFSIALIMPIIEILFKDPDDLSALSGGSLSAILGPLYQFLTAIPQDSKLLILSIVCGVFLFLIALTGAFRYLQEYMVYWLGSRIILDLQRDLFQRMTRFNAAFYAENRTGSLISYFTVDIRAIGNAVFKVFGQLLLDPFLLLFTISVLLYMQWKLTLIYALVFPAIIYSVRHFARKNRKAGRESQDQMAHMGSLLQEHFSQIRLVQVYGMYSHQQHKFWGETISVFRSTMSMLKAIAASSPINQFIGVFAFCCVLLLGGYFIFHGSGMEPAEFVLFLTYLGFIYQPTKRIERSLQELQLGLAAADRVFSVMDTNAALPEKENPVDVQAFQKEITLRRVSFSYSGDRNVLSAIDFTAQKGQQIAIVGPSGAGKTTLVNLIPRFYDPTDGAVLLDGLDLREISLVSLRQLIGIVPQDVAVFSDSIEVNITCGDPRYSREEVIEAARAAYADDFIAALPQGYDSVLGENGLMLSGGQCQRIAIARAFLRNAPILILDEATSSLDSESERHIKNSLQRLMKNRTSFVIAHRLSTILQADRILVLDQSRLIDSGSHAQLLHRCELYRRLYRLQFHDSDHPQPLEETVSHQA